MKKTFSLNLPFLIPYFIFLLFAGALFFNYSKTELHLIGNQYHSEFFDYFFYYATYLGDGVAVLCMLFLLCFIRYRYAILAAASNAVSALLTQTLKYTFFSEIVRPIEFFKGKESTLYLVQGVENYSYNTFPSGHTTAAFATFFCFAMMMENRFLKFLMFLVALMIGLSRVYLSQHFLSDIYAGSLIGTFTSFLIYTFLSEKLKTRAWTEGAILKKK